MVDKGKVEVSGVEGGIHHGKALLFQSWWHYTTVFAGMQEEIFEKSIRRQGPAPEERGPQPVDKVIFAKKTTSKMFQMQLLC